jgi:hypothetical protein
MGRILLSAVSADGNHELQCNTNAAGTGDLSPDCKALVTFSGDQLTALKGFDRCPLECKSSNGSPNRGFIRALKPFLSEINPEYRLRSSRRRRVPMTERATSGKELLARARSNQDGVIGGKSELQSPVWFSWRERVVESL